MKDRDRNELHLIIGQVASSYKRAGHDYAVARFLELLRENHDLTSIT